jgi:MFS family permease
MSVTSATKFAVILIVVAGSTIALLQLGIRGGFGIYLAPMSSDLGWGREVFALSIAVQNILWGLGQPAAGYVADRYGSGRVLAIGGLVYAAGIFLMAHAASPTMLHLSAGVLVGFGMSAASFAIVLAAVARAVAPERRSMVMGIVAAMGSLGQVIMIPIAQAFMSNYGWSVSLMVMAAFAILIVPLSAALTGKSNAGAEEAVEQTFAEAIREASSHSGFLYLTAGFFVCGFHITFVGTHLPAFITDSGLSAEVGAMALIVIGLFNVIGSLLAGYLGGKFQKRYLLSLLYLFRAVAILGLILLPLSEASVFLFSMIMGFSWLSTVPLTSAIVAQVFGPRYMATLFGFVFFSHQIGAFLGVWLGGYLFDATGSYETVWWIAMALGLFAAAVHMPINEKPIRPLVATG